MEAQQVADRGRVQESDHSPRDDYNNNNNNAASVSAPLEVSDTKANLGLGVGGVNESGSDKEQIQVCHGPVPVDSRNQPQLSMPVHDVSRNDLPSASDVRRVLGLTIARNAQARLDAGEGFGTFLAEPQGEIHDLLTDGICHRFAEQMRLVQEQKQSFSNTVNGLSNMHDSKMPKASQAMLMSQRVHMLEGLLLQDQSRTPTGTNNLQNSNSSLQIPIPLSTLPSSTLASSSHDGTVPFAPPHTVPSGAGVAVPLDSKFLKPTRGVNREEGEIMSSKTSSVTPPNGRNAPPFKKDRSSPSPEPVYHGSPTSRTYRMPLSSDKHRWPPSPHHHTSRTSPPPEPLRRSYSPGYTGRPLSPNRSANRPSSPGWKRQRASSRPHHPYPYEPRPPISSRFPRQRRASEQYTRPQKPSDDGPFSWRGRENRPTDTENKHQLHSPDGKKQMRSTSGNTTSSDHRTPSYERRRGSTQDWKLDTRSSSVRRASTHSMSSTNSRRADSAFRSPDVAERIFSLSKPESIANAEPPPKPCHNVPGLWMIKTGARTVEIVTCEFEIDKIAADRWGIRGPSRHGKEKAHDTLSLSLACVPLSVIAAVKEMLDMSTASPQDITNAITQFETVWPPAGHLVIEINPDREWGRSWLPRHLGEDHSSIDITEHVHEGTNVIRLIQLAGLADCMFIVLANEKPPDVPTVDAEPVQDTVNETRGESQTIEQLLNSFKMITKIMYS
ncbi:hypothetical protein AX15_002423 [Amanita polypyramis BW_CC]|nr:hypothetical protein AX15_002423 [Amanita polypyramis BW_CC]